MATSRARRRAPSSTPAETPEQAVAAAEARGEEVKEVTGPDGKELLQRPLQVDLRAPVKPPPYEEGDRVLVYHKRRTTMFLTDCKIGPEETKLILKRDAELPGVKPHIIRVAQ